MSLLFDATNVETLVFTKPWTPAEEEHLEEKVLVAYADSWIASSLAKVLLSRLRRHDFKPDDIQHGHGRLREFQYELDIVKPLSNFEHYLTACRARAYSEAADYILLYTRNKTEADRVRFAYLAKSDTE